MKPKDIYELEEVDSNVHWADSLAFFYLADKEIDDEMFDYEAARGEDRIETILKAESDTSDGEDYVSYWVVKFDGKPLGLVRLIGRHEDVWDRYITDYPLYQAMVGYVKVMYTPGNSEVVVGEDEEIEDLDNLYGWVVDSEAKDNLREDK